MAFIARGARPIRAKTYAEEGLGRPFRRSRGLNRMILMRPAPPCDIACNMLTYVSARTPLPPLQNGSFSKGCANWCAEGPRGRPSIDAFEFAAACSSGAKLLLRRGGDRSGVEWHGS
jgi:hypothetical protein